MMRPWLSNSVSSKIEFVRPKIEDWATASLLGVKSFWWAYAFASDKTISQKFTCTGAYLIRKKLQLSKLGMATHDPTKKFGICSW